MKFLSAAGPISFVLAESNFLHYNQTVNHSAKIMAKGILKLSNPIQRWRLFRGMLLNYLQDDGVLLVLLICISFITHWCAFFVDLIKN